MLARIVHKELTLGDAGRAERVRFDNVRPRLQKPAMDVTDHLRLSEGEEVAIVQQILFRILEALPADVPFVHAVCANCCTHRSVDNGNATLKDFFKSVLVCFCHISL